jgi:coproporphyrinogen III oxidase-like Fe-S oxidoreductase
MMVYKSCKITYFRKSGDEREIWNSTIETALQMSFYVHILFCVSNVLCFFPLHADVLSGAVVSFITSLSVSNNHRII